ncbi:MAG: RHS repeat-associated core domain-containing protein, partial [Bacteroidota bacterium]
MSRIQTSFCMLLIGLLVGLLPTRLQAVNEHPVYFKWTGAQLDPAASTPLTDNEPGWVYMSTNTTPPPTSVQLPNWYDAFNNAHCRNIIAFGMDLDQYQPDPYTAEIVLLVTAYRVADGTTVIDPVNHTVTLSIDYNPERNSAFVAKQYFDFEDGYKVDIDVLSLTINGAAITNPNDIPDYLQLESTIEVERYYTFFRQNNPSNLSISQPSGNGVGEMTISWDPQRGAEEYDLEWTFVDDYDGQGGYLSANDVEYDFGQYATRVNTKSTSYVINEVFDHGYLVARVRAVGRTLNAPQQRQECAWSLNGETGTIASLNVLNPPYAHIQNPHEKDLTWQYAISFAENGLQKDAISYYDATLRNRQAVTLLRSQNQAVVQENIYDSQGRPSISVLPVPLMASEIRYYPDLHLDEANNVYNWKNFDPDVQSSADPMQNDPLGAPDMARGAAQYYSPFNPEKEGSQAFVPDAQKYPFSQTTFTPDATGRPRKQGGVGFTHQISEDGHFTEYFYADPKQYELNRLFGTEVGYEQHYKKHAVVDPNGQVSIAYIDAHGRTVATALAGPVPENLLPLPSHPEENIITVPIDNLDTPQDPNCLEAVEEHLVVSTGEHTFNFGVDVAQFDAGSCTVDLGDGNGPQTFSYCADCVYDLTISVTNEEGVEIAAYTHTIDPNAPHDAVCDDLSVVFNMDPLIADLEKIGVYTIRKTLCVNQQAIDDYVAILMDPTQNNCLLKFENFLPEPDLDDCDAAFCTVYCENELGDPLDWVPGDNGGLSYEDAVANCVSTCEKSDQLCEALDEVFAVDFTPGQQYMTYDDDGAGNLTSADPYSILTINNSLGIDYTGLDYSDPVFDGIGNVAPSSVEDFIDKFDPDWGEVLKQYHPEFCKLAWCEQMELSRQFDLEVRNTLTWDEADGKNWIDAQGLMDELLDDDDFFKAGGPGATFKSAMQAELDNFQTSGFSAQDVAKAIQHCHFDPNNPNQNSIGDCLNNLTAEQCREDGIWLMFRSFYLALKGDFVAQAEAASNCNPVVPNTKEVRFPSLGQVLSLNGLDINALNDINSAQNVGQNGIDTQCESICDSYTQQWEYKLQNCGLPPAMMTDVIAEFKEICKLGCDAAHPYGSSTTPDDPITGQPLETTNGNSSFAQVLNAYNGTISDPFDPAFDPACNALLITMPPTYNTPAQGNAINDFPMLDECACEYILQLRKDFNNGNAPGSVTSLEEYFEYEKGFVMPDIKGLVCDCEKAWTEEYGPNNTWDTGGAWGPQAQAYLSEIEKPVPFEIACSGCLSCGDIDFYFTQFGSQFNNWQDGEDLFANWLNQKFGFNLSFSQYEAFYDDCKANGNCDPQQNLDDLMALLDNLAGSGQFATPLVDLSSQSLFTNSTLNTSSGTNCNAQMESHLIFSRDANEAFYAMRRWENNSWILAGQGGDRLKLIQLKDDGSVGLETATEWPGTGFSYDEINLIPTGDGGVLVASIAYSDLQLTQKGVILAKYDNQLDRQWMKVYDESGIGVAESILGMVEQSNGSFVVGYLSDKDVTTSPVIFKVDANGNRITNTHFPTKITSLTFNVGSPDFTGAAGFDQMVPAPNGGFYLAGRYNGGELMVQKFDQNANPVSGFDGKLSGMIHLAHVNAFGLVAMADNGVSVVMREKDKLIPATESLHLIRMDENGNLRFAKEVSWDQGVVFSPQSFITTDDEGLLLSGSIDGGSFANQASLLKLDWQGEVDWHKNFGATAGDGQWVAEGRPGHYLAISSASHLELVWETAFELEAVCDLSDHQTALQNESLSSVSEPHTENTLTLTETVDTNPAPISTQVDFTNVCGESLFIRYFDQCGIDCEVNLSLSDLDAFFHSIDAFTGNSLSNTSSQGFTLDATGPVSALVEGTSSCLGNCGPEKLCNEPIMVDVELEDECLAYQQILADHEAATRFEAYKATTEADFRKDYVKHCLGELNELFTMSFRDQEHHYTLYYYDQAGNLIQTISPEGVDEDVLPIVESDAVNAARNNALAYADNPDRNKRTEYRYNSLNQIVWQHTPDGGESRFWYDHLGRLVASQDARQATLDAYAYMLYDGEGRPVEAGRIVPVGSLDQATAEDETALANWLASGTKSQITRTHYDVTVSATISNLFVDGQQSNLRTNVASIEYEDVTDPLRDVWVHYDYDEHGNVKEMIWEMPHLEHLEQVYKHIQYEYDLFSGNVLQVKYQPGELDQFYHRYEYDDDNRIKVVETSRDGRLWEQDAHYDYYLHGPLARIEYNNVQGVDFAYTIQGWIKAVNGETMDESRDMGKDGYEGNTNPYNPVNPDEHNLFGRDAFGYSLGYFNGDYQAINSAQDMFMADKAGVYGTAGSVDLFNGNINHMVTTIPDIYYEADPLLTTYRYDQLNRIREMKAWRDAGVITSNSWTNPDNNGDYQTDYTFDADGNLLTLNRNGTNTSKYGKLEMDELTYHYRTKTIGTKTVQLNQLRRVHDKVPRGKYHEIDIDSQSDPDNYAYDEIGNLIGDVQEDIAVGGIEWSLSGKIRNIKRTHSVDDDDDKPDLSFYYGPDGNRIAKIVKHDPTKEDSWDYTYYVRDAQGNVMAAYTRDYQPTIASQTEPLTFEKGGFDITNNGPASGEVSVLDGGTTVLLEKGGMFHYELEQPVTIGPDTWIQFDFRSDHEGTHHAIGFHTNLNINWNRAYVIDAMASSPQAALPDEEYDQPGVWKTYLLPYGQDRPLGHGVRNYIFLTCKDMSDELEANSYFRNIKIFERDTPAELEYTEQMTSEEFHLYGSDRLGLQIGRSTLASLDFSASGFDSDGTFSSKNNPFLNPIDAPPATEGIAAPKGMKHFEGKDHRGNVLVTFSDRRLQILDDNLALGHYFIADVTNAQDYYPYGMKMGNRGFQKGRSRYGFNGKENDDAVYEEGNTYDFGARIYDARLGRWFSSDPKESDFPDLSTYTMVYNNPMMYVDPNGESGIVTKDGNTLVVTTHLVFYADADIEKGSPQWNAFQKDIERSQKEISEMWNNPLPTTKYPEIEITIDGETYTDVRFETTNEFVSFSEAKQKASSNYDHGTNFIRMTTESRGSVKFPKENHSNFGSNYGEFFG